MYCGLGWTMGKSASLFCSGTFTNLRYPLSQCLHKTHPLPYFLQSCPNLTIFFNTEGIALLVVLLPLSAWVDWRRQVLVGSTLPEAYRIEGVVGKMSFPCIGEMCSFPGGYPFPFPCGGGFWNTWEFFVRTLHNFGKWYVNDLSFDEGTYFFQGGMGKTTTYSHFIATFYWSNMLGKKTKLLFAWHDSTQFNFSQHLLQTQKKTTTTCNHTCNIHFHHSSSWLVNSTPPSTEPAKK